MPNRITHADELPYDNSTSGLSATTVQDAVDEIAGTSSVDELLIADDDLDFLVADDDPETFLTADPEPA